MTDTQKISILLDALFDVQTIALDNNGEAFTKIRNVVFQTANKLSSSVAKNELPEPTFRKSHDRVDYGEQPHERFGSEDVTTDLGQSF